MATRSRTTRAAAPAATDTASAAVGAKAGTKASPEVRAATGTAAVVRAVRAPRKTTVKTALPPVAPRTAATRDPERTSAAILAAAVKEFREHGYGGARIDAIAKRANINKRMLYHYFGDKDALYLAVLEGAYMQIRAAETRLHLADLDPVEGVRQLVLFTWRYYQEHPEFLSLLGTENLLKAKFLKRSARIFDLNSPLLSMLSDMLRRGEAAGQFRPDQDALDVYLSIAGMNFFYLSNRHTLTATFRRDLGAKEELARWGEHVADVIVAFLKA
jgi:AcrR family transcriptional regulator